MATAFTPTVQAFRAHFAALSPADAMKALGWLLEPGIGDPEPELTDDLIDALAPVTKAYQDAYAAIAAALDPETTARDRAADEADYRYEQWRDERDMREYDREQAA